MNNISSLRETFNSAADDYNAIRPGYPEQLFADVVTFSGIPENGQALEIGCGPGQATLPFARMGYNILCLDIGPDLLVLAAENLRAFPNVRFENIAFEDWPLQAGAYDLVYAATSFHWVAREIGYPKAAQALRPGGALAIFANTHPSPFSGFFEEVQPIYDRYLPEAGDQRNRPNTADQIEMEAASIRATGLFSTVEVRTYPWSKNFTTVEYLRLLNTYSGHRAIPEERRRDLYQAIAGLIDGRFDGQVERPYLTELYLARKGG